MRRPPEWLQVAALGAIQGAAELLPVSSSAHVAAVPWLLGWDVAGWEPARRKELEVALHAGALAALAPTLWRLRPDARAVALALAPPVVVGYLLERPIEARLGGPAGLASGLLAGAAALAAADRVGAHGGTVEMGERSGADQVGREASAMGWRGADGSRVPARVALALGVAQAAALWPGVSRSGATLAVARGLGLGRAEASRLSFGVAGPVLAGATMLKAWRGRRAADRRLAGAGALAAFAGTSAALRAVGIERRAPLWPYAAERALLAAAILAARRRPR